MLSRSAHALRALPVRPSFPRSALELGALACLVGCSGGGGGGGGGSQRLEIERISNGFSGAPLLPHQIYALDPGTGQPNRQRVIELRSLDELSRHLRPQNPVHAPGVWRLGPGGEPVLPNGAVGNHFVLIQFTTPPALDSIFDPSPAGQNTSGLVGSISVSRVDSTTGALTPIRGRGFLGGKTPDGRGGYASWLELRGQRLIDASPNGEAAGFPGVASSFSGADSLASPKSFVFVPDEDGDLATFESFPRSAHVRIEVTAGVATSSGRALVTEAVCAGAVGADVYTPEALEFSPRNGAEEVDPLTAVIVAFTEPVQPLSVGELPGPLPPGLSSSISLSFGPQTSRVDVPYTAEPVSVYDLTRYRLRPLFHFPGRDPLQGTLQALNEITVQVNPQVLKDLVEEIPQQQISANLNLRTPAVRWRVGDGPGLVNAPVAPSAIYVGRSGSTVGISVIDLYGFGQSTGDPRGDDPQTPLVRDPKNHWLDNPNLIWGATMVPPISAGTSTLDGGSGGFLTLTRDSSLNDLLARSPLLSSVDDLHIGHPLDKLFNNSMLECRSGGGNICAATGPLHRDPGGQPLSGNSLSYAPHPNPPKLVFPPICLAPFIQGEEPTMDVRAGQPARDLLGLGDPLGRPSAFVPPSGLLVDNDGFFGPVPPSVNQGQPAACRPYAVRQQIGHFLYAIDRNAKKVKVFNSNRMTLLDEIELADPTDLAISGNLRVMAVTNFSANTVSFVDIDPASPSFHQVTKTVPVGAGPRGCAFHSENEDLLVANFLGNSVTVIRQLDLSVRKTLTAQIARPLDIAVTPRQITFGYNSGLYFAYVLNQGGSVAVMESGPDGTNGIGYDDIVGLVPANFANPQSIQVDPVDFNSAVWIAHTDTEGRGAVSRLALTASPTNPLPLSVTSGGIILPPSFRDRTWSVTSTFDFRTLTPGLPADTALDNLTNIAVAAGVSTQQAGVPAAPQDAKSLYRILTTPVQVSFPKLLFIANSSAGVVDVIDLGNSAKLRSIPAAGVRHLADYWRQ
ncbi:MAG: hypothetical protein IPN34_24420 [Planctomycetes bacterium]|nr:hypothetical protein [Planctomycetota bacterium]